MALWRANGLKCFHCGALVGFFDLAIDHLIAESTAPERLAELVVALALPQDFTVDCPLNLVPAHLLCNSRKSDHEFPIELLRFNLATWGTRQGAFQQELAALRKQTSNGRLLSRVAAQIASGQLAPGDLLAVVRTSRQSPHAETSSEPWVVCFGLATASIQGTGVCYSEAPKDYPGLCDWLEARLLESVRSAIPSPCVLTEPSTRNGETLAVRIAFWNLDVGLLDTLSFEPFQILEVVPFSEVYEGPWGELFARASIQSARSLLVREPHRCPQCGSLSVTVSQSFDRQHGELYDLYRCGECAWTDWSQ